MPPSWHLPFHQGIWAAWVRMNLVTVDASSAASRVRPAGVAIKVAVTMTLTGSGSGIEPSSGGGMMPCGVPKGDRRVGWAARAAAGTYAGCARQMLAATGAWSCCNAC